MGNEKEKAPEEVDEVGGGGIFTNPGEVVENIKEAAEGFGIDSAGAEQLAEPIEVYYAKKSCKRCCGRGILSFVPNPTKDKKNFRKPERFKNGKWRDENMEKIRCSCVRARLE